MSTPEVRMYEYLLKTGTSCLDSLIWFAQECTNSQVNTLILHSTKECKNYSGRQGYSMPDDHMFITYSENKGTLQSYISGTSTFSICTDCPPSELNGKEGRQAGHALERAARLTNVDTASKYYRLDDYEALNNFAVTTMAKQELSYITKTDYQQDHPLMYQSYLNTVAMLNAIILEHTYSLQEFTNATVDLAVRRLLDSLTRTDSLVRSFCGLEDKDTDISVQVTWARGLQDAYKDWKTQVMHSSNALPDPVEFSKKYADNCSYLGISHEKFSEVVSKWNSEYSSLSSRTEQQYVGIYGIRTHHYSVPDDIITIATHAALIHDPVGSFAYGVMPLIVAEYIHQVRRPNAKVPSVLPLGVPYTENGKMGTDVLSTALALMKLNDKDSMYYQNARESLLAALSL